MVPTFIVLMPIVVATLAGDCVAGEMQEGSLKLYVSRPRSRSRIILSKFFAVYLATLLYCLYFAVLNIAIGVLVLNISPTQLVMLTDRCSAPTWSSWESAARCCATLRRPFTSPSR